MVRSISTTKTLLASLAFCAAIAAPAAALADCRQEIAHLESVVREADASPAMAPDAPETAAARLHRQPTPASVAGAESQSRQDAEATFAEARKLDEQGKEAECRAKLRPIAAPLGL